MPLRSFTDMVLLSPHRAFFGAQETHDPDEGYAFRRKQGLEGLSVMDANG